MKHIIQITNEEAIETYKKLHKLEDNVIIKIVNDDPIAPIIGTQKQIYVQQDNRYFPELDGRILYSLAKL